MEKGKAIEIFNRQIDCYKTDREECIILASCSHCEHNVTPEELTEAMQTAISALEKQERETREKPFPFVVGQPAEMFIDGKWEKGKIVAGYRFNDGIVTIETEDGRRFWCGQDRTDIYRPYQEDEA